jgi:hypothetical protein
MELEHYEKWEPVEGIMTPASRAWIRDDYEGLTVTLIFSKIIDGLDKELEIWFGRVPAYTVHEEFVHPWNTYGSEPAPKLDKGQWDNYNFPLRVVKNSVWLRSFSEIQLIHYPDSIHYNFVTLDQTVDVLCNEEPEVSWIDPLYEFPNRRSSEP